ncbi:MAG: hypothetical protein M3Q03_17470 [Chloroflexota bacterium]|nr:hypothetical protein [Chloroflexota bacterium]
MRAISFVRLFAKRFVIRVILVHLAFWTLVAIFGDDGDHVEFSPSLAWAFFFTCSSFISRIIRPLVGTSHQRAVGVISFRTIGSVTEPPLSLQVDRGTGTQRAARSGPFL